MAPHGWKKALLSTRMLFRLLGIKVQFEDVCLLTWPDGTTVPFIDDGWSYLLERYFTMDAAHEARKRLLCGYIRPCPPLPRLSTGNPGNLATMVDSFLTASADPAPPPPTALFSFLSFDVSEFAMTAEAVALKLKPLDVICIRLWHSRMGHQSPYVLFKLPVACAGADVLHQYTRAQFEEVTKRCGTCRLARMKSEAHSSHDPKPREATLPPPHSTSRS